MNFVKFNPTSTLVEDVVPAPKPARNFMPNWYKKTPAFSGNKPTVKDNGVANTTVKMCMPFVDSMNAGYIQESWQDININIEEEGDGKFKLNYSFPSKPNIIDMRESPNIPLSSDFYPFEFTFHPPWIPELPKGWSMLYVHPLNRFDLPFQFLSGFVDSDSFTQSREYSNMPFYIKSNFTGIIPKGTPMVQMIPVKRSDWKSSIKNYSEREQSKITNIVRQKFWGGYKNNFWSKKIYK